MKDNSFRKYENKNGALRLRHFYSWVTSSHPMNIMRHCDCEAESNPDYMKYQGKRIKNSKF